MLTEFFANTVHVSPFNINKFNQTEYLSHISKLIKEAGIEDVDGKEIRNANLAYNTLTRMITHHLYSGSSSKADECLKTICGTSGEDVKTWKTSEIREKIKTEVDKNPMLKYIMGTHQVTGNLTDLKSSQNPILEDRNSYYGKSGKDWVEQMSQENIDLFKIQLSSLIK
jgi:hypothetical protein